MAKLACAGQLAASLSIPVSVPTESLASSWTAASAEDAAASAEDTAASVVAPPLDPSSGAPALASNVPATVQAMVPGTHDPSALGPAPESATSAAVVGSHTGSDAVSVAHGPEDTASVTPFPSLSQTPGARVTVLPWTVNPSTGSFGSGT